MKNKVFTLFLAIVACLETNFAINVNGIVYNLDNTNFTAEVTSGGSYTGDIIIPESINSANQAYRVTSICSLAFYRDSDLISITIPNSVTSIGLSAFSGCSSLTSVIIPNSVTTIGQSAFSGCSSLTSITIPNSVTNIEQSTFSGCSSLTSIIIPDSVTNIYSFAFLNCTNLASVTIGKNVTSIGRDPFYGCNKLTKVTLNSNAIVSKAYIYRSNDYSNSTNNLPTIFGAQVKNYIIGEEISSIGDCAFAGSANLTSLIIGDNITEIGTCAFYNCTGLTSMTIFSKVVIKGNAFYGCSKLDSIIIHNDEHPILQGSVLPNNDRYLIYVPCRAVAAYQSAWSGLVSRIRANPNYRFNITRQIYPKNTGNIEFPSSTCADTTITAVPNYGYHFVQWRDGVSENPRPIELVQDTTFSAEFELNTYSVRTQTSNPGCGITTGDTMALYMDSIIISASAYYGYHFVQWTDGVTDNPRTIVLTSDTAFAAEFAKNTYTIEKIATNGNVSGLSQANYLDSVVLTATPNYGYHFVQWNDSITDNPRTFKITCDTTFAVDFAQNPIITYTYDFVRGYVSGDTITPTGIAADSITFEAIPYYGYHFVQWNDSVSENPRSIFLFKDTAFMAEFSKNSYSITTESSYSEWGVTSGDTTALYLDTITLMATPNYGYHFVRWQDGSTQNPRNVTITANKTYQAMFEKNIYSITKICNATYGSIDGVSKANYLDTITLSVIPNYGYHFAQWNDNVIDNPRVFVLTQDTIFTAGFDANKYSINVSTDSERGSIDGNNGRFDYLTEHVYTAIPNYGYHFAQWSDGVTQNPRTLIVERDSNIVALFENNIYNIVYHYNQTQGIVNGISQAEYLQSVSVEAVPNHGYHFVQWSDSITENPRTFVLTQDTAFTAEFAQTFAGQCGDSLYWAFSNDSLAFSGSGDMYNYIADSLPWLLLIDQTKYIEFAPEMTSICTHAFQNMVNLRKLNLSAKILTIGDYAFDNCTNLDNVTIPNSVTSLGAGSFYGCTKIDTLIIGTGVETITNQFRGCIGLRYVQLGKNIHSIDYGSFYDARQLIFIVCHPTLPPMAYPDEVGKERSFYNTNAQVLIPCDNFDAYQYDALWGSFNLKCLSSNSGTAVDGQVIVVPGDADATFTWPTDGSADTYNLEITKDSATFCSLIFDSEGRLLGIAFAPSVNGQQPHVPMATLTTSGMSFQVTGLDYASQYRFSFETKDNKTQTLFAYTGGFHTNGADAPEGFEDISAEGSAPQKVMIDGQIFILRGEKVYTLQGQEVK